MSQLKGSASFLQNSAWSVEQFSVGEIVKGIKERGRDSRVVPNRFVLHRIQSLIFFYVIYVIYRANGLCKQHKTSSSVQVQEKGGASTYVKFTKSLHSVNHLQAEHVPRAECSKKTVQMKVTFKGTQAKYISELFDLNQERIGPRHQSNILYYFSKFCPQIRFKVDSAYAETVFSMRAQFYCEWHIFVRQDEFLIGFSESFKVEKHCFLGISVVSLKILA